METNRFNYTPKLKSNQISVNGYIKNITSKFIFGDELTYVIPKQFEYRPDLISRYLYGSVKYAWLLSVINKFYKTPSDFYSGRAIIYTNPSRIN
jgi:hypothetical protein